MVSIDGIDPRALSAHMMDRYRIVVNAVSGGTPPAQDVRLLGPARDPERLHDARGGRHLRRAMLDVAKNGLPPAAAGRAAAAARMTHESATVFVRSVRVSSWDLAMHDVCVRA